MAKKGGNKGSFGFDYHSLTYEQKQKVTCVCDQFPEAQKDIVAIVLEQHDFDQDKAIDSLTIDGGASAVSAFNSSKNSENSQAKVNSKNKKKNKKRSKKENNLATSNASVPSNDADDSSSLHSSNVDFDGDKDSSIKIDDCDDLSVKIEKESLNSFVDKAADTITVDISSRGVEKLNVVNETPLNSDLSAHVIKVQENCAVDLNSCAQISFDVENSENVVERSVVSATPQEKTDKPPRSFYHKQQQYRQRHNSSQHSKSSSISEDVLSNASSTNAPSKGGLPKCKRDLSRQAVSLQRIESELENKLEESSKNIKKTFSEVQKMLEKRQADVVAEMEKVKQEALNLLKSRQDLATDLKRKVDRSMSMHDSEWNDLRIDIKQFVTERKYDEELGKTIWFHWSMDEITEAINKLGEVCPVKNAYSQRHLSHSPKSPESNVRGQGADGKSNWPSAGNEEIGGAFGSTYSSEPTEAKVIKDIQAKSTTPNEGRSRVFSNSNTRYNHAYNSGYANHGNRSRGGFHKGARGNYLRGRQDWQYSERHSDYRKQYHNERTDFHQSTNDKALDTHVHNFEESSGGYQTSQREGNQGHYRSYDRKPYTPYRQHNRPPMRYGRGANRIPRSNAETAAAATEVPGDKNANYENQTDQGKRDIPNGF